MIWKHGTALLMALVATAGVAQAQDFPGNFSRGALEGDPVDTQRLTASQRPAPDRLIPEFGGVQVFGWLNGGYIYNATGPGYNFNGPYNAVDQTWPMGNQAYVVVEKALKGQDFDLGGRADFLYGFDFLLAQSRGFEVRRDNGLKWNNQFYGFAIPQLYLEGGNEDISLKVGHFYSIVGYEGLPAVGNFFYSHSYSYQFAGPFTHWGGIGAWKVNENLTVQAGVVNGWNALNRVDNAANFIGGAKWTDDLFWTSFAIVTGPGSPDAPALGGNPTNGTEFRYSAILGLTPTENLEYVFHQWLGYANNYTATGATAMWYGIDQYLYYKVDDNWRAGARLEWFRDEDGTRVGLNRPANPNKRPFPGSFYSATVGANWSPNNNVRVRPEVRYDWYDGRATNPFANGNNASQIMLGCDVILQF